MLANNSGYIAMEKLLEKISSYNIFNFFFPGAIFSALAEHFHLFGPPSDKIVDRLIWYYFVGLAISRIGSIVVEPMLKAAKIVRYSEYSHFITASSKDEKLAILVEVSNTYRTLLAMLATLAATFAGNSIANHLGWSTPTRELILFAAAILLFGFSFRKQSDFISRRVEHHTRGA